MHLQTEIETEELILLLYVNNNHYDLMYQKRNIQKNKKLYINLDELDRSCSYKLLTFLHFVQNKRN